MAARKDERQPIGVEEADRLLAGLEHARGLALAVSGGADSVALMRLVAAWRERHRLSLPVKVLTVDHGLRPESADEAGLVSSWSAEQGLPHETLRWDGPKPAGNLQAAAREARYRLLLAACDRHGLSHLLTAHHLDDQAETLLLRLARGSGVDGLAAMVPLARRGDVLHARPLLDMPKARLEVTLVALGQSWIEDPSNISDRFSRARLRRLMPALAEEGLDALTLSATARRFSRARRALETMAEALEREVVTVDPAGFAHLRPEPLLSAEEEIGLRALSRILRTVGGSVHPPRLERLERLWRELHDSEFAGATLCGCEVRRQAGAFLVWREWGRQGLPAATLAPGQTLVWDNRFKVRNARRDEVIVAPLGERLAGTGEMIGPDSVPRHVLRTVPAAFAGGEPVAMPIRSWRGPEPHGGTVDFRFVELDQRPPFCGNTHAAFT